MILHLRENEKMSQRDVITRLTQMQYERNDIEFKRGMFRVRGDVIDIFPAEHAETAMRVELFDDVVETLHLFDPLTGQILSKVPRFTVFPSSHYVTPRETTLARDRTDQGRTARAPGVVLRQQQTGRSAAAGTAHPLRSGNDGRTGFLQGHRKLFAPSVRAQAGRAAADADRLPAARMR